MTAVQNTRGYSRKRSVYIKLALLLGIPLGAVGWAVLLASEGNSIEQGNHAPQAQPDRGGSDPAESDKPNTPSAVRSTGDSAPVSKASGGPLKPPPPWPTRTVRETAHILQLEPSALLAALDLDHLLDPDAAGNARLIETTERALTIAVGEYKDLFESYGVEASKIAIALRKRGLGRKPPADFKGRVGHTIVGTDTVYYTSVDYPELFEIKRALLQTPDRLRDAVFSAAKDLGLLAAGSRAAKEHK